MLNFLKKHIKCISIIVVIILIIICGINVYINGFKEFIKMNMYDALTIVIAVFVTYYLTEKKSDTRKLNDKIENVCNDIQNCLRNEYKITPSKNNKEKVLTNIRYVSNKIHILDRISEENDVIKSAIEYIKEQHKGYNDFVSCNFDQNDNYFLEETRQEKINTFINNMDNKLDEIVVYIYTDKAPTVK